MMAVTTRIDVVESQSPETPLSQNDERAPSRRVKTWPGQSPQTPEMAMATFQPGDDHRHTDLTVCQEEVDDLRALLRTLPAIEQAKGILMAQHGCTPDEAFSMLSAASQRSNRKLCSVAEGIVVSVQADAPQCSDRLA
jgi:hypothetical protein